ncbi:cytochrome P450 [Citricoccus zhacaiensis]
MTDTAAIPAPANPHGEPPAPPLTVPPAPAGVPVVDLDPFSDETLTDPYPLHEALREAGPVAWLPQYGVYAVARYDEVVHVLQNHEIFVSGRGVGLSDYQKEKPWRPPSLLLEADPPQHTQARKVATSVFNPKTMRQIREEFQDTANRMVDDLFAEDSTVEIDGVAELAAAYPLSVFPDFIGLSETGRESLLPYGNMAFNAFGPQNHLYDRAMETGGQAAPWIVEQCVVGTPKPGRFGATLHEKAAEAGMDEDEAARLLRSFLTAGVDTTVHGIGAALRELAEHPEQWAALRQDPSKARAAFDETVRYVAPVQTFFRTVNEDTEVSGVHLPEGSKILMFLAAANRDPRHWEDPDTFDISRQASGHVGFGFGIHSCVGQIMARLEGECLLGALARKVTSIEVIGEPELQLNNTLRGWERLPMRLTAA